MRSRAFGLSDVGRRREINQDQFVVDAERGLYAIADGMGGHAAGEVASQIAVEALTEAMRRDEDAGGARDDARRRLVAAFHEGNRRICEAVLARGEWRGMGTTIVALLEREGVVVIGHVGDSRAYRLRDGTLRRLTEDHSWVGEQIRLGLLTEEDARHHHYKNIVTRAMGNRQDLDVDVGSHDARPGDTFLLCSDGLNNMLTDEEIAATLVRHRTDAQAACRSLIAAANERGGEDNITVIVLICE